MKKNVLFLGIIFIVIIIICMVAMNLKVRTRKDILQQNNEYEIYLNNEIYGTSVITLINKAISNNETNNVTKDERGIYQNNNTDSIQIDLVMITNEEKKETTTYKMEKISKVGITEFIKNFNTAKFKCTNTKYHKTTGKIAYIELTQQSE